MKVHLIILDFKALLQAKPWLKSSIFLLLVSWHFFYFLDLRVMRVHGGVRDRVVAGLLHWFNLLLGLGRVA